MEFVCEGPDAEGALKIIKAVTKEKPGPLFGIGHTLSGVLASIPGAFNVRARSWRPPGHYASGRSTPLPSMGEALRAVSGGRRAAPGAGDVMRDAARKGIRGHLERWGLAEDWDKIQEEREQRKAEERRERRALEERMADPFGRFGSAFGPGETATGRTFSASRDRTRNGRREPERSQWEWESPWKNSW